MPFKNPEYRRQYRKKWYSKNKESEKAHVKRRKLELKKWFFNYKKTLSCLTCKENHIATLEFHHKEGSEKKGAIINLVNNGCSIKKIEEEIKKCGVLCSNCHKKLHYRKRSNKF
jgi:hypothetical protein